MLDEVVSSNPSSNTDLMSGLGGVISPNSVSFRGARTGGARGPWSHHFLLALRASKGGERVERNEWVWGIRGRVGARAGS